MFYPAPLTQNVMTDLKENLERNNGRVGEIKQRLVEAQDFENASKIREIEKEMESLLAKVDHILTA